MLQDDTMERTLRIQIETKSSKHSHLIRFLRAYTSFGGTPGVGLKFYLPSGIGSVFMRVVTVLSQCVTKKGLKHP